MFKRNLNAFLICMCTVYFLIMNTATPFKTGRHVVFSLHAHLVFVAKYRRCVFTKEMLQCMKSMFHDICQAFECSLEEFDGEADHVHLMIHYPPKVALSKLVNHLKGISSRKLRAQFKQDIQKCLWKGVLWSPSYFVASCGGAHISIIKEYIQSQNTPL